ncbi:hypothetical protein B0H11DRAFT_1900541 [Mycena galericulata]|nr:hypothetical protein B0H11DRAFT_1900541 [Mycena galericulata]
MATRATRRLLTLALTLALALPKSTLPPVLPLPTLVPALPPRPAPVCVAGLLRPSRVVAGMPQCLRVPSRTSLRPAVHSQACSPQCTAPTPRFLWTPTAPALCASPHTLNSRFGKASSRSNVSFAFGVVFAHADIDAFETRALYVQRIVVGEVGKGLGNGRLRALLGGKGLAAFVQKTGYGVAVRVGSSRGLRLVGSLWRRHKATVISCGHRHLWKLLFLISVTAALLAFTHSQVVSIDLRDIDAIESALAWAFSGLQLALPLLPHGRPLGLVVGELAKTLGRGKLRKLATGIGVDCGVLAAGPKDRAQIVIALRAQDPPAHLRARLPARPAATTQAERLASVDTVGWAPPPWVRVVSRTPSPPPPCSSPRRGRAADHRRNFFLPRRQASSSHAAAPAAGLVVPTNDRTVTSKVQSTRDAEPVLRLRYTL